MIWTETKVKVIISDEMRHKIDEVLDGLNQLQDIMDEHNFSFKSPHSIWFDSNDLDQARDLLAALTDTRTEFL